MSKPKQKTINHKKQKSIWKNWRLYVMCLPAVLFFLLFAYKPMYGILIAFKKYNMRVGIMGSEWIGLDNFKRLFSSYWFPIILKNTLTLSLLSLILGFPLPIILALLLNEVSNGHFRKTFQTVSYAPHFISTVVICSMITLFMNQSSGLINNVIAALGGKRVDFLGTAAYFPHIYVWSGVWQNLGWGTIIYLATLSAVSPELHEAAYLDGANRMQIILHVNIPCILPTVVIMLIMNCGTILSVGFEKVYLLQNALNLDTSQTISTYNYELGLLGGQYSYTTAIGLFNTVVNVVMLTIVNTVSRRVSEISLW